MQKIRLHLGPHKTATTYLQHVLDALRPEMAAAGQFYLFMEETRASLTGKINCAERARNAGFRGMYAQRRALAELRRIGDRFQGISYDLLLSDENLLGEPGDSLAGRLYPSASARLSRLRDALPGQVGEVFFCVRDYAPFLASLHAEAIRWGTDVKPAALIAAYARPQRHWSELIARIQEAFPAAQLHIWPFEEFTALRSRVLTMITRLSDEVIAAAPDQILRPGISQSGIAAALKAFETTPGYISRQGAVLEAEARCPQNTSADKYDPWPIALREEMSALYCAELAELRAVRGINLLSAAAGGQS